MVHSVHSMPPRLHNPPAMGRQPSRLETDDVSNLDASERRRPARKIAGAKNLKIVRCRMARQTQIRLFLPKDFMEYRGRNAYSAEATYGQVIAVANQSRDRIADGRHLVRQRPRLLSEVLACTIGRRVGIQGSRTISQS